LAVTALLGATVLAGTSPAAAVPPQIFVTTTADVVDGADEAVSLREAVSLANDTPGPDSIVLDSAGTYSLTRCDGVAAQEDANIDGDLDVTEAITLFGDGATVTQTCVTDSDPERLLHVVGNVAATLYDVSLSGGRTAGLAVADSGAVVRAEGTGAGALVLDSVTVSGGNGLVASVGPGPGEDAGWDGAAAVAVPAGGAWLVDSHIVDNVAVTGLVVGGSTTLLRSEVARNERTFGLAGGVYISEGTLALTDSTIADNVVLEDDSGEAAGGIYSDGEVILDASVVAGNDGPTSGGVRGFPIVATDTHITDNHGTEDGSSWGGGFVGSVRFERVLVSGNSVVNGGGGGFVWGSDDGAPSTIVSSTISANVAGGGGALLLAPLDLSVALVIERTVISGNTASDVGGISGWGDGLSLELRHATISDNVGGAGEVGADDVGLVGGSLLLESSVIGSPGSPTDDCAVDIEASAFTSLGGNVSSDSSCGIGGGPYDLEEVGGLHLGPVGPTGLPGDPVPTSYPQAGSPLVGRLPAFSSLCGAVDQQGTARPQGQGCEPGAVEVEGPPMGCKSVPRFPDVPVTHMFCPGIEWMADRGFTTGYTDGSFRPTTTVSRQAIAAQLFRMAGQVRSPSGCAVAPFTDVPVGHPFCTEISWAKSSGLTGGFGDGSFRPTEPVSRVALAAFVARLAGSAPLPSCAAKPFDDVETAYTLCPHVAWASDVGVITGYSDGTFRPAAPVTRQAASTMLFRAWSVPRADV